MTMREAVMLLAQQSGWGLQELLALEEADLIAWLETGRELARRQADA